MSTIAARIDIRPTGRAVEYARGIFGHFIEHFHRQIYGGVFDPGSDLSDARGFRLDVLEALRELQVATVRWPGGCFASAYHWRDGIGPARQAVYDPAWRVSEPNTFGTDEFLAWCAELGAAPYICANAGTGTPQEMADWLEYANRPVGTRWSNRRAANGHHEPYGVGLWSIGNENYGDWEIGAKSGTEWAAFVTESAKLMRRVDPSVALLAPAVERADWALPMLGAAGPYLNYLSIHGYWDPIHQVNTPAGYLACMAQALAPSRQIALARSLIQASGQSHIKIAFDEWNLRGWHHPVGNSPQAIAARDLNDDNSTYTMADAVFAAGFLNACLRNADIVGLANLAPTVNTRGALFVHPGGIVKRTTFHVISLYANRLGPLVLDAAVTSTGLDTGFGEVPVVDAIATGSAGGPIVLALVNRDESHDAAVEVRVDGRMVGGAHGGVVLAGPSPDAYNDIDQPNTVVPVEREIAFADGVTRLPAHSLTIVTLDLPQPAPAGLPWSVGATGDWHHTEPTPERI
jgi:alpha-N-arabinofuranosidase